MPDSDPYWTIGGTIADALVGQTPTVTRGTEITLSVIFEPAERATFYTDRYHALLDYLDYANEAPVETGVTQTGRTWYKENTTDAPVTSFVVGVDPSPDIIDATGFWGIVTGGQDRSVPIAELRRLDLTLFVLAELDEFADRAAVETALSSGVI